MSDKVDDIDATPPPPGPSRTLKLKGPRIERAPAPLPGKLPVTRPSPSNPSSSSSDERPNFLTRIDQIKRQMQADMDALADPKPPYKKRP
jgi:hypothetical protein